MSTTHAIGLGEPEGKKSLFRPPSSSAPKMEKPSLKPVQPSPSPRKQAKKRPVKEPSSGQRVRMTMDLTPQALAILQNIQHTHRLQTGRALPLWKAVSDIIERHGERNGKKR